MKPFNRIAIIGITLCAPIQLSAQDTIFTKSKEPLLVRVLEISKVEVRYKNFYNPDGIIYKIDNSTIVKIVYENGKVESRFQLAQKTEANPTNSLIEQRFVIEGNDIALNNKDISYKMAFNIMLKRDPQINSDGLNERLLSAESKKNAQLGFIIVSPLCFIGGTYFGYKTAKNYYYGKQSIANGKAIFLTGLGLAVVTAATSLIFKSLKNKQIRKAALLYNQEL